MTIDFYSLEQQDEFVLNIFDQKTNGTFLDISCWHPIGGSNTYTLEKQFGWKGIGFDLMDSNVTFSWNEHRTSPFVQMDVGTEQFAQYLKNNVPQDQIIDYISLDVDDEITLHALNHIVAAGVKFKSVTFEHEYYKREGLYRDPSRKILEDLGFVRLFSDVKCLSVNHINRMYKTNDTESFEDWWIHPDYFDQNLLSIQTSDLYYDQCIDVLKKFKNVDYQSKHHCCRAFPEEFSFYLQDQDRPHVEEALNYVRSLNHRV